MIDLIVHYTNSCTSLITTNLNLCDISISLYVVIMTSFFIQSLWFLYSRYNTSSLYLNKDKNKSDSTNDSNSKEKEQDQMNIESEDISPEESSEQSSEGDAEATQRKEEYERKYKEYLDNLKQESDLLQRKYKALYSRLVGRYKIYELGPSSSTEKLYPYLEYPFQHLAKTRYTLERKAEEAPKIYRGLLYYYNQFYQSYYFDVYYLKKVIRPYNLDDFDRLRRKAKPKSKFERRDLKMRKKKNKRSWSKFADGFAYKKKKQHERLKKKYGSHIIFNIKGLLFGFFQRFNKLRLDLEFIPFFGDLIRFIRGWSNWTLRWANHMYWKFPYLPYFEGGGIFRKFFKIPYLYQVYDIILRNRLTLYGQHKTLQKRKIQYKRSRFYDPELEEEDEFSRKSKVDSFSSYLLINYLLRHLNFEKLFKRIRIDYSKSPLATSFIRNLNPEFIHFLKDSLNDLQRRIKKNKKLHVRIKKGQKRLTLFSSRTKRPYILARVYKHVLLWLLKPLTFKRKLWYTIDRYLRDIETLDVLQYNHRIGSVFNRIRLDVWLATLSFFFPSKIADIFKEDIVILRKYKKDIISYLLSQTYGYQRVGQHNFYYVFMKEFLEYTIRSIKKLSKKGKNKKQKRGVRTNRKSNSFRLKKYSKSRIEQFKNDYIYNQTKKGKSIRRLNLASYVATVIKTLLFKHILRNNDTVSRVSNKSLLGRLASYTTSNKFEHFKALFAFLYKSSKPTIFTKYQTTGASALYFYSPELWIDELSRILSIEDPLVRQKEYEKYRAYLIEYMRNPTYKSFTRYLKLKLVNSLPKNVEHLPQWYQSIKSWNNRKSHTVAGYMKPRFHMLRQFIVIFTRFRPFHMKYGVKTHRFSRRLVRRRFLKEATTRLLKLFRLDKQSIYKYSNLSSRMSRTRHSMLYDQYSFMQELVNKLITHKDPSYYKAIALIINQRRYLLRRYSYSNFLLLINDLKSPDIETMKQEKSTPSMLSKFLSYFITNKYIDFIVNNISEPISNVYKTLIGYLVDTSLLLTFIYIRIINYIKTIIINLSDKFNNLIKLISLVLTDCYSNMLNLYIFVLAFLHNYIFNLSYIVSLVERFLFTTYHYVVLIPMRLVLDSSKYVYSYMKYIITWLDGFTLRLIETIINYLIAYPIMFILDRIRPQPLAITDQLYASALVSAFAFKLHTLFKSIPKYLFKLLVLPLFILNKFLFRPIINYVLKLITTIYIYTGGYFISILSNLTALISSYIELSVTLFSSFCWFCYDNFIRFFILLTSTIDAYLYIINIFFKSLLSLIYQYSLHLYTITLIWLTYGFDVYITLGLSVITFMSHIVLDKIYYTLLVNYLDIYIYIHLYLYNVGLAYNYIYSSITTYILEVFYISWGYSIFIIVYTFITTLTIIYSYILKRLLRNLISTYLSIYLFVAHDFIVFYVSPFIRFSFIFYCQAFLLVSYFFKIIIESNPVLMTVNHVINRVIFLLTRIFMYFMMELICQTNKHFGMIFDLFYIILPNVFTSYICSLSLLYMGFISLHFKLTTSLIALYSTNVYKVVFLRLQFYYEYINLLIYHFWVTIIRIRTYIFNLLFIRYIIQRSYNLYTRYITYSEAQIISLFYVLTTKLKIAKGWKIYLNKVFFKFRWIILRIEVLYDPFRKRFRYWYRITKYLNKCLFLIFRLIFSFFFGTFIKSIVHSIRFTIYKTMEIDMFLLTLPFYITWVPFFVLHFIIKATLWDPFMYGIAFAYVSFFIWFGLGILYFYIFKVINYFSYTSKLFITIIHYSLYYAVNIYRYAAFSVSCVYIMFPILQDGALNVFTSRLPYSLMRGLDYTINLYEEIGTDFAIVTAIISLLVVLYYTYIKSMNSLLIYMRVFLLKSTSVLQPSELYTYFDLKMPLLKLRDIYDSVISRFWYFRWQKLHHYYMNNTLLYWELFRKYSKAINIYRSDANWAFTNRNQLFNMYKYASLPASIKHTTKYKEWKESYPYITTSGKWKLTWDFRKRSIFHPDFIRWIDYQAHNSSFGPRQGLPWIPLAKHPLLPDWVLKTTDPLVNTYLQFAKNYLKARKGERIVKRLEPDFTFLNLLKDLENLLKDPKTLHYLLDNYSPYKLSFYCFSTFKKYISLLTSKLVDLVFYLLWIFHIIYKLSFMISLFIILYTYHITKYFIPYSYLFNLIGVDINLDVNTILKKIKFTHRTVKGDIQVIKFILKELLIKLNTVLFYVFNSLHRWFTAFFFHLPVWFFWTIISLFYPNNIRLFFRVIFYFYLIGKITIFKYIFRKKDWVRERDTTFIINSNRQFMEWVYGILQKIITGAYIRNRPIYKINDQEYDRDYLRKYKYISRYDFFNRRASFRRRRL